MRRIGRGILVCGTMLMLITACGEDPSSFQQGSATSEDKVIAVQSPIEMPEDITATGEADSSMVDLTILTPTMVYGEVFQMMYYPENYVGRKVKMQGLYDIYHDDSTGKDYHACIIQDATACCAQGIEFELSDSDYPGEDTMEVTVEGIFTTYDENGTTYCTLSDAVLIN